MKFIDLDSQYRKIESNLKNRFETIFNHKQFIGGPEVTVLENTLAQYVGVKHCITTANGSDSIFLALMALGIGEGDEVITSPFTYVATAEMIQLVGATPVFVDIDEDTYNINPDRIATKINKNTKAIMPVSIFGQCADFNKILSIAEEHQLFVIEDGAQSFGASLNGKRSCSFGDIGCTSFFPTKPLGCYGDGGAIFTNDGAVNELLRSLKNHGQTSKNKFKYLGINSRLDSIQAAVLLEKIQILNQEIELRQSNANRYSGLLSCNKQILKTPEVIKNGSSVWAQYTIKIHNRDLVISTLKKENIPYAIYYEKPLYHYSPYCEAKSKADCPVTEEVCSRVLSLPMHPWLTEKDQCKIANIIYSAI